MQELVKSVKLFKGLKNDEDAKQVPAEYFYKMKNFGYSETGLLGISKILMPTQIVHIGTAKIDGLIEYRYLNNINALITEYLAVTNGNIYKAILGTPVSIYSGLTVGKISYAVFNDKLYIANGKNYITIYDGNKEIVYQMGAPEVETTTTAGNPNGVYYYAMTYVTAGGEEVIGTVSNTLTVASKKITVNIPIGYSGTLTRNIYRTKAGGAQLYLIAAIPDNTTMSYLDNIADVSLVTPIPATNNEMIKPYFISIASQKIYAGVVDKYPTQVFISGVNIEVIDPANSLDVGNYGVDNTPVKGLGTDFNKIIVGTEKNIIMIDPASDTPVITRANVGIKDGYSVKSIPATANFPGGMVFVSNLNDVRVLVGMQALPVSTSLDNVRSDNLAQDIRGDIARYLVTATNIHSEFINYKYHLLIDYIKYVYDTRLGAWSAHDIRTKTYQSKPACIGVLNNNLYNGQLDGWVELEYSSLQYQGEDVEAFIESPQMTVSTDYKFIEKIKMWFIAGNNNIVNIEVVTDENEVFKIDNDFYLQGGVFNGQYFNPMYFRTGNTTMDYRVVNINRFCRWLKYRITSTTGNVNYQGFEIYYQDVETRQ